MDLLKDKKKLPLVIGLAVFVLLGAGGLIALELGAFNPPPAVVPTPVASSSSGPGSRPGTPDVVPGGPRPGGPPAPFGGTPTQQVASRFGPPRPGAPVAPAAPVAPVLVNPASGPDPFNIPGGTKRIAARTPLVVKAPLRAILPAYNLFQLHPPAPPPPPIPPDLGNGNGQAQALPVIIQGIVKGDDGIYAIASVNGQSQTIKPGDSLLDGSRVVNIQDTGVTIRSATGVEQTVPISNGGTPGDQGNGQGYGQPGDQSNGRGGAPPDGFGNGPQPFNQ